ncbi:MAG: tetratricopeptide repeat protein [Hyphomicrobiaceae bacterium]
MQRLVVTAIFSVVLSLPVFAQTTGDWSRCQNEDLAVKPADSIAVCDSILKREDLTKADRIRAQHFFARGYEDVKDYDRALVEFTQVIELDPTFAEAYIGRGTAYVAKGEFERGIREYTRSLEIRKRVEAYYGRGRAYHKKGDKGKAVADYRAALALDPKHQMSIDNLKQLEGGK